MRRRSEVFDWILLSAIFLCQSFKVKSFLILHHRSYRIVLTHSYLNNSAFLPKTLYVFPPYNPDRPPLMVIYSHVAINDKLENNRNSEKVRST